VGCARSNAAISATKFEEMKHLVEQMSSSLPPGSIPPPDPSLKTFYRRSAKSVDHLRLRRFKCNCCSYRSNYKSDVTRHIKQKHWETVDRSGFDSEIALLDSLVLEMSVNEAVSLNSGATSCEVFNRFLI